MTKNAKKVKESPKDSLNESPVVKQKFQANSLPTLEKVTKAFLDFSDVVSSLENEGFVKSLRLNLASINKKLDDEIVSAKTRTLLKEARQAIKDGKTITIN